MKRKVLVVAGKVSLRAEIAQILQPAGYVVELAGDAKRAQQLLVVGRIDAAIVASSTLGAQSHGLIDNLRDAIGVVIVLADDDCEIGKLSLPGVLIVRQPVVWPQLLDRLHALLKPKEYVEDPAIPELLGFDGRTLDLAARTFYDVDQREVPLTRAEFQLLATFLRRASRVLSRDQLRDAVVGRRSDSYDRSVDMLVARLRRKIEPNPKVPRFILTVPGEGYKFTAKPHRLEPQLMPAVVQNGEPAKISMSFFERREMTVVACQIGGFAALATTHDPEDMHAAMSGVFQAIQNIVLPFNGMMVKMPGESFLVYFGYPEAREDDTERAVRAGLELARSVPSVEIGQSASLHLRVGISTGVMLVGSGDTLQNYSAIGEPLNLALYLRSVAPPDGVVIAANTRELLGRMFDCEQFGPVVQEGTPLSAWRVTGESAAVAGRFDALRRGDGMLELVGRDEQMYLLLRRWNQAQRGNGQVVMLTGEPGIGKSRLVAELEQRIATSSYICQKYFGLPHQTDASMFAVVSELQHACGFNRGDSEQETLIRLEKILRVAGGDISGHVALISDLLSVPNETKQDIAPLSAAERKRKTFTTLLERVNGLAAAEPLLVIVEDIQWIDPASLEFMALLVERVLALPILIVITSRPGFIFPWPAAANVTMMELPRLDADDARLLIERVAGGKSLPKDVTREILAPTDGIPLFIEELTRSVLETGMLREGEERYELDRKHLRTIPRTLRGSLIARFDRLGSGKEIAQIGAVIGREFSYELICAISVMPEPALRTALDRLGASELIYCRGTPPLATYTFKHALVRDVAYEMLLRPRRCELHGAIARALENSFPEIGKTQPELLAHHYKEADNIGKAVHYLSVAGDRALSRSALTEAYRQITEALRLISRMTDDDGRRRDELALQIALARTLLEQKGYADSEVGEAYAKAAFLLQRIADPRSQLAVHYGLCAHHYIGGKPIAMLNVANEFLELAKRQNETGPIVTGYRLVGTARLINGDIRNAKAALDQALAQYDSYEHGAATQIGQDLRAKFGQDVGVTVYSYLSWAGWLAGWPDQAADAAAMAEEKGRASGHAHSLYYALWHAGVANVLLRNETIVARLGGELTKHANDRELPYWQALGDFLLGWHAKHAGRTADAIELLQRGLVLWEQRGSRVFRPLCMAFLADAYTANDQLELAYGVFDEALRIGTETGERWAEPEILRLYGDAFARGSRERPTAAISCYERAIASARQQGARSFELRAAISLVRVAPNYGKKSKRLESLSNIYKTFTEGFHTADLIEAKTLLEPEAAQ